MLIEDFLSYIDASFPYLNPFDKFHQCKNNPELLGRRIRNLLAEIAFDEDSVMYQRGWGYYIKTRYTQIGMIGLILIQDADEWKLELSLYFGATQAQAISFYSSVINFDHLENTEWEIASNFHVSFMTTNLVHFPSKDNNLYLNYWKENIDEIYQQRRNDVEPYLKNLIDNKIIETSDDIEDELDERFYSTKKTTLNICPGFAFLYEISSKEAEQLDKTGKLSEFIKGKIIEGLKVAGLDGKDLIRM